MTIFQVGYRPPFSPVRSANKNLDGDPMKVEIADQAPEPGLRIWPGGDALVSGFAVDPTFLPTRMQITSGPRAITDYDGDNSVLFISRKLKEIIEALVPGVHQFFPIELVDRRKAHLADHWVWIVCNRIDSVDRTHTTWILRKGKRWTRPSFFSDEELPPGYDRAQPLKMVFNEEQIGGGQFWRDSFLLPNTQNLFCSQAGADAMRAAELTGIKLFERETV